MLGIIVATPSLRGDIGDVATSIIDLDVDTSNSTVGFFDLALAY